MDVQDERHFILIKENICKAKIFHKLNITYQNIYKLKKEKKTLKKLAVVIISRWGVVL